MLSGRLLLLTATACGLLQAQGQQPCAASGGRLGYAYSPYRQNQAPPFEYRTPDGTVRILGLQPTVAEIDEDIAIMRAVFGSGASLRVYDIADYAGRLAESGFCLVVAIPLASSIGRDPAEEDERNLTRLAEFATKHRDRIAYVLVGNETQAPVQIRTQRELVDLIGRVRGVLPPGVRVSAAEIYSTWLQQGRLNEELARAVDFVTVHLYPYFDGRSADDGASYLYSRLDELAAALRGAGIARPIVVGETGFPSEGRRVGDAVPGPDALGRYLADLLAWAPQRPEYAIFWFNVADAYWQKVAEAGRPPEEQYGVEASFGIFTFDRRIRPHVAHLFPAAPPPRHESRYWKVFERDELCYGCDAGVFSTRGNFETLFTEGSALEFHKREGDCSTGFFITRGRPTGEIPRPRTVDLSGYGYLVVDLRADRGEPAVEVFLKDDKSPDDGLDVKVEIIGVSAQVRRAAIPLSAFADASRGIDFGRMYVLLGIALAGAGAQSVGVERVFFTPSDLPPPEGELDYRRVTRPRIGDPEIYVGACVNRWLDLGTASSGTAEGILGRDPSDPGALVFCAAPGSTFTSMFFQVGPDGASRTSRFQDWSAWPWLAFEAKGSAGGEPLLVSMQDTIRSGARIPAAPVTASWRTFAIPTRSFGVNLAETHVPAEFLFLSPQARHCVSLRNVRFTSTAPAASQAPAPVVTGVVPATGPPGGGNPVEVRGRDFAPTPAVRFGPAAATAVTFVDSGRLRVIAPAGRGVVPVTVANPDNQSFTLNNSYTYLNLPPVLTQVTPSSGSEGTSLTLLGREFQQGATVLVGPNRAGGVTWVNSGQIFAVAPAGGGVNSVTVTNPDNQSSTLADAFTYAAPSVSNPSISAAVQACSVRGTVSGATPATAFRLLVWSKTDNFYIQPCLTEAVQSIRGDGGFGPIDLHNGDVYLQLVSATFTPSSPASGLPPVDGVNVFFTAGPVGTASGCDVARCPAR
jgi:exo-beta-1,3-glucanase (GH17 family)